MTDFLNCNKTQLFFEKILTSRVTRTGVRNSLTRRGVTN